jgi:hypothetical protein
VATRLFKGKQKKIEGSMKCNLCKSNKCIEYLNPLGMVATKPITRRKEVAVFKKFKLHNK